MDFTGQNVLVTGASRGVGRAIARAFAEHGAGVVVHYRSNRSAAEETLTCLEGGPHHLLAADLRDPVAIQRLVSGAARAVGRIDVLVNNAGVYEDQPVSSVTYEEWQSAWNRVLGANLLGPANLSYCVAQHMREHGGGRIVNVSSRGAFRGEPSAPAYGASKAGLNALGQSLAKALGKDNIFVFTVAPGFIETDMTTEMLAGPRGDSIRGESPLGRVAQPEEVAWSVLLLAAPGTEFMTGCIVDVNGASYLRT
ncbi:MAG TPA: SDR family oxidoreductase [Vicinamibacterales bacterium]|nr:SDR family oxidoreductase [Vicinamibacterales bacterium]